MENGAGLNLFKELVNVVKFLCFLWQLSSNVSGHKDTFKVHPFPLDHHPDLCMCREWRRGNGDGGKGMEGRYGGGGRREGERRRVREGRREGRKKVREGGRRGKEGVSNSVVHMHVRAHI